MDTDNRCVYNGLEYELTGRYATNKTSNNRVFEIRPVKTFGFEDLVIWAPMSDLFIIEKNLIGEENK